jgi:hypothetical protein
VIAPLVSFCAGCVLLLVSACGGGGGDGGSTSSAASPQSGPNVAPIVVDLGPSAAVGVVNTPFVTVTLCAPGGTACQTIDHISVDTGSSGFRVISSVLSPALAAALPQAQTSQGPLVECVQFADGYSWGPVKTADLQVAGEKASGIPIQVIGDPAAPPVPADCSSAGRAENTVVDFGANGILGVSVFQQDCGPGCAGAAIPGAYYACPAGGCTPTAVTLAQQLPNPATAFTTDANGVIVQLPAVSAVGGAAVVGYLIFGIDTQSNNSLGMATVFKVDPSTGNLNTIFNNQALSSSFLDSGSNGLFFNDSALTACSSMTSQGFYCPGSTQSFTATIQSVTGITANVSFSVANADQLFNNNPSFTAFNNLAGPTSTASSFDWGLPFFFGRNVYTAFESGTTSAGPGPFVAF